MTLKTTIVVELCTYTDASEAANSDHHRGLLQAIERQIRDEIARSYHQEIYVDWEQSHRVENTVNVTVGRTEEP